MPLSARLSRKLYETFGDDAAHDMVDWMQQIDAQRSELRELNEANFARFAALLNEKFGELRGEFSSQSHRLEMRIDQLEIKLEQRSADLIRWSFVFWVGAVGAIALLAGALK
jgi:hypothetical protein